MNANRRSRNRLNSRCAEYIPRANLSTPHLPSVQKLLKRRVKDEHQHNPGSPFINFFREFKSKHQEVPIVKLASTVSKLWNNMSLKEKRKYIGSRRMNLSSVRRRPLTMKEDKERSRSPPRESKSNKSVHDISETDSISDTSVSTRRSSSGGED